MQNAANCKHHPKYKAKLRPRCDCLDCWKAFCYALEGKLNSAELAKGRACLCVHDPIAGQEFVLQINDHCPQHGHLVRL